MKNLAFGLLAAVAGLALIPANAAELRLGDFQSTTHIVSKEGTQKWMAEVNEMTGGEVAFQHFPAEQAAKSKEMLDAVKNGILDAGLIGPIYHAEELPLNSVVGLPGFYTSAVQGTEALQTMMADGPLRGEMLAAGVVPIFAFVLPPYQILSKDVRLGMPDEWKGLHIRTSGATQAMIARDLGAAGVSIGGPEVYSAVETGRLDGVLFPLASVPGYNLQEVVKHISTNGSFGGYSFVMVVNKDSYDGLSQEAKDAMAKAGADAAAHVAKVQDESVSKLTAEWAANGIDIYSFTDEERAAINEAIAGAQQEWLERIGGRNPKAADVVAQYKTLTSD
ncbi:TRAP transporter substrate-binding protein DctP [Oricola sp.]|uniref:TRAP transporter substrate-binding protein n=1 Tax=Oricola sp. TaxID=1979950 RepID=UPI0025D3F4A9|nr:TRAP transporter substrate-binding protein DctP [Oricola sp.]MCI5078275.1 TRAP transporter substrate-binding protein DctP [Oricola sp.]